MAPTTRSIAHHTNTPLFAGLPPLMRPARQPRLRPRVYDSQAIAQRKLTERRRRAGLGRRSRRWNQVPRARDENGRFVVAGPAAAAAVVENDGEEEEEREGEEVESTLTLLDEEPERELLGVNAACERYRRRHRASFVEEFPAFWQPGDEEAEEVEGDR